jgi:hypothetical protein
VFAAYLELLIVQVQTYTSPLLAQVNVVELDIVPRTATVHHVIPVEFFYQRIHAGF